MNVRDDGNGRIFRHPRQNMLQARFFTRQNERSGNFNRSLEVLKSCTTFVRKLYNFQVNVVQLFNEHFAQVSKVMRSHDKKQAFAQNNESAEYFVKNA